MHLALLTGISCAFNNVAEVPKLDDGGNKSNLGHTYQIKKMRLSKESTWKSCAFITPNWITSKIKVIVDSPDGTDPWDENGLGCAPTKSQGVLGASVSVA